MTRAQDAAKAQKKPAAPAKITVAKKQLMARRALADFEAWVVETARPLAAAQ